MSTWSVIVFVALCGLRVASEESVDFSSDANSEFNNSGVDARTADNEIADGDDGSFLGNFKSLHNATDLQALPSTASQIAVSEKQEPVSSDRVDTSFRVLRGSEDEHLGLEHPVFSAHRHNTIDNADFSDCALQGEWQPIGVPSNHYGHHEDHQREHFHAAAEQHEAYPTIAVQSTKQPLDPEGAAFWNQFLSESKGNPHLMGQQSFHKGPKPNHFDHSHHQKHHYHQKKRHNYRPPPPLPSPSFNEIEAFSNVKWPHPGEANIPKAHPKPSIHNSGPIAQSLVSSKPSYNDIEFALLHKKPSPPPEANSAADFKNVDYLSPPPAPLPQRVVQQKPLYNFEKPKHLQHRQKYFPKPPPPPPSHAFKGPPPFRPPPQVTEHLQQPTGSYQQNNLPESSSFTCGHQHSQGTNYHTASYQVEGESDPSLLDESPLETQHFPAPQIILGHPHFDHGDHFHVDDNAAFHNQFGESDQESALDQHEEGTETGPDGHAEFLKGIEQTKNFPDQVKEENNIPETATQETSLETTAPQTFHVGTERPVTLIVRDSVHAADTLAPTYTKGFDHSGYSKVTNLHDEAAQFTHTDNSKFNFHVAETSPSRVVVHQEHSFSHSDPSGYYKPQGHSHGKDQKFYHQQRKMKQHNMQPPGHATSYFDFSQNNAFKSKPNGKYHHKESVAVFHHPPPHNSTKTHLSPKHKHPHKDYEVNENGGEMIPLSAFFPPRKGSTQFNNRQPNFAGPPPKGKRPKAQNLQKYQSTIQFDGSGVEIYQSRPKNSLTRIKLKPPNKGGHRYADSDFMKNHHLMKSRHD